MGGEFARESGKIAFKDCSHFPFYLLKTENFEANKFRTKYFRRKISGHFFKEFRTILPIFWTTRKQESFSLSLLISNKVSYMLRLCFCLGYLNLKGTGHVTVNNPVISRIHIVAHTWPLCSAQILVDGVNP